MSLAEKKFIIKGAWRLMAWQSITEALILFCCWKSALIIKRAAQSPLNSSSNVSSSQWSLKIMKIYVRWMRRIRRRRREREIKFKNINRCLAAHQCYLSSCTHEIGKCVYIPHRHTSSRWWGNFSSCFPLLFSSLLMYLPRVILVYRSRQWLR